MKDRVDFNITKNGISVGANVTRDYFEERVLPLITTLLVDLAPAPKRRSSPKRAAKPEPKAGQAGGPIVKIVEQRLIATPAPDATRTAAISSYRPKSSQETSATRILA